MQPTDDKPEIAGRKAWAQRRRDVRPQMVAGAEKDWVRTGYLAGDRQLPLLIEPRLRAIDLAVWIEANRESLEARLLLHGGLLFRGFGLETQDDFQLVLAATGVELMHYVEGATPRTELGGKIYTSTEFPSEETIAPHNELCYVSTWPAKIWFFCLQPPATDGETPLVDVRRVLARIDPAILERFERQGWMLMRNFGDGFGPSWQHAYRQQDRAALEAYFRAADIEFEWKEGDRVRTRQVRPAVVRHPRTGEAIWFNHIAFWHVSSLKPETRAAFLAEFREEDLPYNTYYGDGSRIEPEVIDELRRAYAEEQVSFPWQRGDLLMLDNMLVAHARQPYTGPRRILTAMGEPESRRLPVVGGMAG